MVMLMILLLFVLPFQVFAGCDNTITITHSGTRVIADITQGLEVIDCVFIDLFGGDGGAIYLSQSQCEVTINGSSFINCSVTSGTGNGGGCYLNCSGSTISRCCAFGCSASFGYFCYCGGSGTWFFDILGFSECRQLSGAGVDPRGVVHFAAALVVNITNVNITKCVSSYTVGFSCLPSSHPWNGPIVSLTCDFSHFSNNTGSDCLAFANDNGGKGWFINHCNFCNNSLSFETLRGASLGSYDFGMTVYSCIFIGDAPAVSWSG
jgi:hypothetical protein